MATITAPTNTFLRSLVEEYLDRQPHGLGFAIGLIGPDFFYDWHFGNLKNQFGTKLKFGEDTPFEIASVSKTFTATLYASSSCYASPSKTLGTYIAPAGPLPISSSLSGITLDSLMSYSSGLPADNENIDVDTPSFLPQPYCWPAMFSYLVNSPPSPTHSGYQYSNLAFALMAAILSGSPVEGVAFTSAIRKTILEPLGMGHTGFFEIADLATLPLGYDYTSNTSEPTPCVPGWSLFPAYYGAGGLISTTRDLLKWLSFNMGRRKISLSSVLPVTQAPATDVTWGDIKLGLGWFISPGTNGGATTIWKDGDLDGFNAYMAFLQSDKPGMDASQAGVFVLVNAHGLTDGQGNEAVATVANDILLQMQGISPATDKSVYPSSRRRPAAPG